MIDRLITSLNKIDKDNQVIVHTSMAARIISVYISDQLVQTAALTQTIQDVEGNQHTTYIFESKDELDNFNQQIKKDLNVLAEKKFTNFDSRNMFEKIYLQLMEEKVITKVKRQKYQPKPLSNCFPLTASSSLSDSEDIDRFELKDEKRTKPKEKKLMQNSKEINYAKKQLFALFSIFHKGAEKCEPLIKHPLFDQNALRPILDFLTEDSFLSGDSYSKYIEAVSKANPNNIVTKQIQDKFLKAADDGDLETIDQMLGNGEITIMSALSQNGSHPLTSAALYRLKNNLNGVRLLLDKYHVPVLENDFLQSVHTKEVVLYLMQKKGMDPYKWHEQNIAEGKKSDGDCSLFSEENINRLLKRVCMSSEHIEFLRPRDYRTLGETLNSLAGVIITNIEGNLFRRGQHISIPNITCATNEDANTLLAFLNEQFGLGTYYDFIIKNTLYSSTPTESCNLANFIKAIGEKAGNFKPLAALCDMRP